MTKTVSELLALADSEIANDDLAPHLSGRHAQLVPARRQPFEAAFLQAYNAVLAMSGSDPFVGLARNWAAGLREQARRILNEADVKITGPLYDPRAEQDITERCWLRNCLEATRVMASIPKSRPKGPGAAVPPVLRPIRREDPLPYHVGKPAFDAVNWCSLNEALLVTRCRVDRDQFGHVKLMVCNLPADIRATVDAHVSDVIAWLDARWEQAGPAPGLVSHR
jgi:hypothetical protein